MPAQLIKAAQLLLFFFLLFAGLYYAKPFLVPVTFAGLISMLLLPLSNRLEARMSRALAIFLCIMVLLATISVVISLLYLQVTDLAQDASVIEKQLKNFLHQIRQQISDTMGISEQQQQTIIEQQQAAAPNQIGSFINSVLSSIFGVLGNFLLMLVYIFLFLYYRGHLKRFILKLAPPKEQEQTATVIEKCRKVALQYMSGLAMMIACLWVLYGIGFTLVGVKYALFFAVLCGLLEIIPFVGNLTGSALTALMVVAQGGSTGMLLGVVATYAFVQSFQTYLLEPLIVGPTVNINPLFTIVIIILGELIWGIPGMVLGIPLLAITKIVCDHIPPLQPFGALIGDEKKKRQSRWIEKIRAKLEHKSKGD